MQRLLTFFLSLWTWFELFATAALLFPVSVVIWLFTLPFDRRLVLLHRFSSYWAILVCLLNPLWKIRVSGKEKIPRKTPFVMVSNHQSGADILVIYQLMTHFKWVSKKSLFWAPFVGWCMAMNRYIPLQRGKKSSINQMVERCKETIRKGSPLMIFPEGTRSKDGSIQPFKTGAFRIALETKVPVVPIVIYGTNKAIKKGGFLIHRNHDMRVIVMDPLPYSLFAGDDNKKLASRVREVISEGLSSCTENPVPPALSPLSE